MVYKFYTLFNINHKNVWASSSYSSYWYDWAPYLSNYNQTLYITDSFRDNRFGVHCFKNSVEDTNILNYRWQTDSTCSNDESDYTSTSRDSYTAWDATATATVTTIWLADGSYYLCVLSWSIADNAWNTNITTKTSGQFIVDNTAPTVSANNSSNSRYTGDIAITLSVSDNNGLNYAKYSRTSAWDCVNNGTSFTNGTIITGNVEWTRTLYLCVEDNAWNTNTWTWIYKLDKTDPVCGTWSYEPPITTWTNWSVIATLTWSTDAVAWIQTGWWSCNISTYNGTCSVTISDKAWRTTVCTSSGATNIDKVAPVASVTTTTGAKVTSQTATLSCSDNVGVAKYYWWTWTNPADSAYTMITSTTNFSTWKTVTAAWTYYLYCKDAAWNVSTGVSQTYYTYTVQNMLDTVAWTQWTYNTTNYATNGSAQWAYLVPSWTTIALNSWTLYGDPIQWNDLYAWWTISNSGTPTYTNPTITANVNYYRRFNRTYYDLELKAGTGIASVNVDSQLPAWYTRVAYIGWTSSKARFNTNVAGGSNDIIIETKLKYTTYSQYGYFWWNYVDETRNTNRLLLATASWRMYWTFNRRAWSSTLNTSFPINTRHTVKMYNENGTPTLNLNGTVTSVTPTQWTVNDWMIAFNANKASSPNWASSVNQFEYFRIYDKWILIRNYVPCKNSNGVYWMYDLVNGTWNPSIWSAQFTWWPEVTWRWVYKYGDDLSISAEVKTWYTWSGWTKDKWDSPESFVSQSTTVTLTQDTVLTAKAILNTYTITYNLDGWANNVNNPSTYTVESWAITLQQPTKTWYTFLWWTWDNGDDAELSVTITSWSTGNRTYNAVWQANIYNINYNLSDGTHGASYSDVATYDTPFTVSNPTRIWFTFAGWRITDMDGVVHTYGTGTTTDSSIASTLATWFNNLHSISWATVNFEALWTINQYNVVVSLTPEWWGTLYVESINNSWSNRTGWSQYWDYSTPIQLYDSLLIGSENCPPLQRGSKKTAPDPYGTCLLTEVIPTESNAQYTYTFSWWNNECGDTVTHDCEIIAEFTRTLNSYDVTFNSNWWTPTPYTQNIAYGSRATKPSDPTRTGYTFAGWILSGNDFDFNTDITWAITLVAKWTLNTYTITYNLNWWTETTANPTSYTVESWAITLAKPTKVWYTFLWWTWANWNVPQTGVTIPAWSTGNKEYNAVWQANTNTQYVVYHYVKPVWSSIYELAETQTWHGTTDSTLVLSWLAKAWFVCVHYRRWSLTWTENWPWEIVVQTTIKWDGSTKIYLYYDRDSHIIHLSGDEHVEYLKINGDLYDESEAVRECGSEVPVEAIPKPWYHFVRWDR